MFTTSLLLTLLPALALAKTDYAGCTSSVTIVNGGSSLIHWVPESGEICQYLDCGGGRAPAKTTVPGCPAYEGTMTYEPSYMPGWGPNGASATPTPTPEYEDEDAPSSTPLPTSTPVTDEYPQGSATQESTLATITSASAPTYMTGYPTMESSAVTLPPKVSSAAGYGNGTATMGSPSASGSGSASSAALPEFTGAGAMLGVAKGLAGVAAGIAGLGML